MQPVRFVAAVLLLVVATTLAPERVSAQAPDRIGTFFGLGLGGGSFAFKDADARETSLSGYLKIGGALNEQLLLGVESSVWAKEVSGATLSTGAISGMAYFYPTRYGGFFLQGGLGIAILELDWDPISYSHTGTALTLGAGYDLGLNDRFALTPFGTFVFSKYSEGNASVVNLGLGINWY